VINYQQLATAETEIRLPEQNWTLFGGINQ